MSESLAINPKIVATVHTALPMILQVYKHCPPYKCDPAERTLMVLQVSKANVTYEPAPTERLLPTYIYSSTRDTGKFVPVHEFSMLTIKEHVP